MAEKKVHRNNCAALEDLINEFLEVKRPHSQTGAEISNRDRMRLILQPFAKGNHEDLLQSFAAETPYASTDRHRHYKSDMGTSQHPEIQNPEELESIVAKYALDTKVTFLGNRITRQPIEEGEDYQSLRQKQNNAWATASTAIGDDMLSKGNLDRAVRAYQHAIEIDQDCVVAHLKLADIETKRQKWDEVFKHLERALELEPKDERILAILERTIDQSHRRTYRETKEYEVILVRAGKQKERAPSPPRPRSGDRGKRPRSPDDYARRRDRGLNSARGYGSRSPRNSSREHWRGKRRFDEQPPPPPRRRSRSRERRPFNDNYERRGRSPNRRY